MSKYYVYILASKKNGTLYIGRTSNLIDRVLQHKTQIYPGFTSKYDVNLLVWYEMFHDIESAHLRERRLKKWNRAWKIKLIETKNPNWIDLSFNWFSNMRIIYPKGGDR